MLPNFQTKPFWRLSAVAIMVFMFAAQTAKSQCGCTYTINPGAGFSYISGAGMKGGDVICLKGGARDGIQFTGLNGSPGNPIIIKNCGGQALIGGVNSNNAMLFLSCHFVKITGTGDAGYNYGIKIPASQSGTQGIAYAGLSTDVEIDHVEVANTGYTGLMIKSDPSSNCADVSAVRPNFTLTNVSIHDCYIHNTGGEGIYLGDSFYVGTTVFCGSTQYCHEVRGVRIYNNKFEYTGRESIQVGSGVFDVEIFNNSVYAYGYNGLDTQDGGIQMGVGTAGRLYNNVVKGLGQAVLPSGQKEGPAIAIQGIGGDYVYNNLIIDPGEQAFTINTRPTPLATDIVNKGWLGGVYIMNNTVVNNAPIVNAAFKAVVIDYINQCPGDLYYNNLMVGGLAAWDATQYGGNWTKNNNIYIPLLANAKFVNPAVDDYRLTSASPAVNAGKDGTAQGFTFDYDKAPRPSGASWDVGAFELAGNQKPVVTLGATQSVTLPTSTITITGSAADPDGTIASYAWSQTSGPNTATIVNGGTASATFSNLVTGIYVFRLTATDNGAATGFADVTVTVINPALNVAPTASAGSDKSITLPINTTTLTGSGVDSDGTIISYGWTKVSGPVSGTLTNANTNVLSLSALVQGTYVFRLTVTDNLLATGTDDVTVVVNPAAANQLPIANAGLDKLLTLPTNTVTLTGSGSDPDGSISLYAWTKQSGPAAGTLTNAATNTLQLSGLAQGTYIFRLTVTDNATATAFDEATVIVSAANVAPTANAGIDKTIQLPTNSVTITGSGSDPDGSVSSYGWVKTSGPVAGTLTNANTNVLSLSGLAQGIYTFRLTVTDNNLATGIDDVTVTVNAANSAPTANAGGNQSITLPTSSITLTGSGSDIDGTIASYAWTKVSGPTQGTLTNANTKNLLLTNLVAGTYVFSLLVTDNNGATGTSAATLVVFPAAVNQSPTVNAGIDVVLTLPTNNAFLTASANDPDGTIATYAWTKLSGPAATLGATNGASLSLTNLVAGVYQFRITVTDNGGASATDDIKVTVSAQNQGPLVNAGIDKIVTLPTTTTTLTAIASDPDGSIATYAWSNPVAPNAATLVNTDKATLSVSGLNVGTYVFRVIVTDNEGAINQDDVSVVVQTATNTNPVVSAGGDQTLFLPTNTINLTATAADADGTIVSYAWVIIAGGAPTLTNADKATLTVSNMIESVYIFRVTVTDNDGGTGIDDVTVTVKPASANQPPIADAGPDIALTLPVNSTNLIGLGSDADGPIASYAWLKLSGPAATLANAGTAVLSVTDLLQGTYKFQLTVTDNLGATGTDVVQIAVLPSSVNQNPVVNAGSDRSINLPTNTTTITATASDPDGTIAGYTWSKILGPTATISGTSTPNLQLSNLVEGTYIFRVLVTDDKGASSFDEITIRVLPLGANQPPVVNAGTDKILFLPTSTANLTGTASDADGTIQTYSWAKISGPTVTMTNSTSATVSLSNLVAGQYIFRLTATDDKLESAFDDVSVTLFPSSVNQSPTANAGGNKVVVLPNATVALTGSGSDADGSIAGYSWTQAAGPTASLTNNSSPTLLVNDLIAGVYHFKLTVTDDKAAIGSDIAIVTVVPNGTNQPPIANAGLDRVLHLPTNSITLNGSGTDNDGSVTSFGWIKKSGPASVTLTGANTPNLALTNLVAGIYQFTLTVTDNNGLTNSDDVTVNVQGADVNQNPIVDAGPDIFFRSPISTTAITATATDPDGSIASYAWTKVSGGAATLAGANTNILSVAGLVQGVYVFRVVVTDNNAATGSDDVTVTIGPPGVNQNPIVDAGASKIISLPVNSTILIGSVSDPDGAVKSVQWTQQSGPTTAILDGAATTTLAVSGLDVGVYTLRITATDNEDGTNYSETTVTVTPNHAKPIVYAGADTTLILPDNFIALTGKATATDAPISDYIWTKVSGGNVDIVGEYPSISLTNLEAGPYVFRLTVDDAMGGFASDDIMITVLEGKRNPIGAPVFFSPNGDNFNQTWVVKNTNMIAGCPAYIFNSLGKKVFETADYQNDWAGTYNGESLKEGDYYFVFQCGTKVYSGAFRLLR